MGPRSPPTEACWLMQTRGGKLKLVNPMGHEGTGEAHH
jgi:hypothetical protein